MAKYCTFSPHLYIGAQVKKVARVKWKLTHGAGMAGIYVICEAPENKGMLSVLHCANLKQPYFQEHPLTVYGIAAGHAEAMDLLVRISDEAAASGMEGALKAYLDATDRG